MKEKVVGGGEGEETGEDYEKLRRKKLTLLQKFGIPVENLDFQYINKCTNVKEVERILRVLRYDLISSSISSFNFSSFNFSVQFNFGLDVQFYFTDCI